MGPGATTRDRPATFHARGSTARLAAAQQSPKLQTLFRCNHCRGYQRPELDADVAGESKSPTVDTPTPLVQQNNQQGRQLLLRIVELLPLLRLMSVPLSKKGGKKPAVLRLLPFRWKHPQGPIKASDEQKINWMSNIPDIVLQSMRRHVCKKLDAASNKYKHVGKFNGVWRAVDLHKYSDSAVEDALGRLEPFERMECGGLLLLGSKPDGAAPGLNGSYLDSVALPQTGSKIPVFDLPSLLSGV